MAPTMCFIHVRKEMLGEMTPYARVSAASCYVVSTLAMCAEEEAGI